MATKMTLERAEQFGAAWNSGDADLVTGFFADDGVYHASVGPDALGKSYVGKAQIRRGVQAFFERFPGGKFENLKVVVADDIGTFEWDFVTTAASGETGAVRVGRLGVQAQTALTSALAVPARPHRGSRLRLSPPYQAGQAGRALADVGRSRRAG